jgi:hypothetical protein
VATRAVEHFKTAQSRAALMPVLKEAPPPANTIKLPAVPKVPAAPSVAIRVRLANAVSSPPVTDGNNVRGAQRLNIIQKVNPPLPAKGKTVSLAGHPLILIDAAGRRDTGKLLRTYLSGRGWSVAKDIQTVAQVQIQTVIYYPASMIAIAKGLTNTLSLRVRMIASPNQTGLKVVLGRDSLSSVYVKRMTRVPYRRIAFSTLKVRSPE